MGASKDFGASGLALLVNESRARRPELSLDRFAGLWMEPANAEQVRDLWDAYAREVYPNDDIELSVRNRFMSEQISNTESRNKEINFINISAGFTSYCYDLNDESTVTETDLLDVIEYKSRKENEFLRSGIIRKREIKRIAFDLDKDKFEDIRHIFSSRKITMVILEGISYYLSSNKWLETLRDISDSLNVGDIVAFDFWRYEDKGRDVFSRYIDFCRSRFDLRLDEFNFLTVNEASLATLGLKLTKLSNVEIEGRRLDDCSLDLAADDVMPEWYAICQVLA